MAQYLKQVEAQQYNGDLKAIKKFLEIKDAKYDAKTRIIILPEVTSQPDGETWAVKVGDYIVKTEDGFIVYKPARFEKEFKLLDAKSEDNISQKTSTSKETTEVAAEEVKEDEETENEVADNCDTDTKETSE